MPKHLYINGKREPHTRYTLYQVWGTLLVGEGGFALKGPRVKNSHPDCFAVCGRHTVSEDCAFPCRSTSVHRLLEHCYGTARKGNRHRNRPFLLAGICSAFVYDGVSAGVSIHRKTYKIGRKVNSKQYLNSKKFWYFSFRFS